MDGPGVAAQAVHVRDAVPACSPCCCGCVLGAGSTEEHYQTSYSRGPSCESPSPPWVASAQHQRRNKSPTGDGGQERLPLAPMTPSHTPPLPPKPPASPLRLPHPPRLLDYRHLLRWAGAHTPPLSPSAFPFPLLPTPCLSPVLEQLLHLRVGLAQRLRLQAVIGRGQSAHARHLRAGEEGGRAGEGRREGGQERGGGREGRRGEVRRAEGRGGKGREGEGATV